MLLERVWSSVRTSLRALGTSLEALGDTLGLGEPLFSETSVSPRRDHDFENLYYQGTGSETMRERLFARK